MTTNRLLRVVVVSLIVGPIAGVTAAAFLSFLRFLTGPQTVEFVSPPESGPGLGPLSNEGARETGPELMHRAQDLVLRALQDAPLGGFSNVEVGEATGLNPPLEGRRSSEVTRAVLSYLVEQGLVEKVGQRYRLAR